uniref:Apple domain-containing protein n=1 Tax=Clytia hemisphaerica TaxID=252671 RepID=A0A7M5WVG7_9CNID
KTEKNTMLLLIALITINFNTARSSNIYQLIAKDKTLASEQPFTKRPSKFGIQCISMCDHSPACLSYAFNGQTCYLYDVMFKTTNGEHRALKDQTGAVYHSTVADSCETWHQLGKRRNGFYYVSSEVNGQQRKTEIYCYLNQEVYTTPPPTTTPVPTAAPQPMYHYKLHINIKVGCNSDLGDGFCEVYGSLNVNIGNRAVNQNIQIWRREQTNPYSSFEGWLMSIYSAHSLFQESYDFRSSMTGTIIFTGQFKEYDNPGTDEILANIAGQNAQVHPADIYNKDHHVTFTEFSNRVEIHLRLEFNAALNG